MADYVIIKGKKYKISGNKKSNSSSSADTVVIKGKKYNIQNRANDNSGLDFFQKGGFEDGFDLKDIFMVPQATWSDFSTNVVKGAAGLVEGLTDLVGYGAAGVADLAGADSWADNTRQKLSESWVDNLLKPVEERLDEYSLLGRTSDSIGQGIGQIGTVLATSGIAGAAGLGTVGTAVITNGANSLSAMGSEMSGAYQEGATDDEALTSGLITGAAEAISSLLFGGLGNGVKAVGISSGLGGVDDMIAKGLTSKINNTLAKNIAQAGIKAGGEGLEEVLAGTAQAVGKSLTYMKAEDGENYWDNLGKIIKDENLLEQFVVGALTSGIAQVGDVVKSTTKGQDFVTGYTANEQKVYDKVYDELVKAEEKNGKKLTSKEKNAIHNRVQNMIEKGHVSTETIAEVLNGDEFKSLKSAKENFVKDYNTYKDTEMAEQALGKEYDTLKKKIESGDYSYEELSRFNDLVGKKNEYAKSTTQKDLKAKLIADNKSIREMEQKMHTNVSEMVKGTRLAESYNEADKRKQKYEADVSQYTDPNAKQTIQNIMDSGVANNTREFHEFADWLAKISADKGVAFSMTDAQKLKGTKHSFDGKTVNGFVDKNGNITLNKDAANALNFTVGHEITHVLEGTEFYKSLKDSVFNYSITKEGREAFNKRLKETEERYKGISKDPDGELMADLIGEYLFSDYDFVNNLAKTDRNLFQKIFDEIKYMLKVATAGSKEARELEKVKHYFEKAYNENIKGKPETEQKNTDEDSNSTTKDIGSEVRYSLSENTKLANNAISANERLGFVSSDVMEGAKEVRERTATRLREMKDNGVAIPEDIKGNTAISNSSYDITEENTTICPRSLAAEAFVDAVSEYLGRPLSTEEQIYISQDLQGRSLTPECTYCYVATDRKAYRAFLGEYIKQRDAVIEKLKNNPDADVSESGDLYREFLNGRKPTKNMYDRFKMWVNTYKSGKPMVEASHLANMSKLMGDINSELGAELKPQIVDAMKYAQSASWAKKRVSYVAYDGHILKWKQSRIDKLNSHYGLRMYSFSDFHPAFVLENMQMITDASVRGLKMLGYTKDIDFVEIFAPTGMNINVSTFGFEAGGNVYENNIIGAEWEKAKALREKYPNVGITFVATSDSIIEWALAQDWIDVVIPYHLVRTGAEVAKAFKYTNYTSESSDTKDVGWDKSADKKYIAPTEHNNDKETYLAALEKNHLKPRFERFLDNPNYMKLVNECRQPASVSKPVQPVFNEDAINTALSKLEANGYYQPVGGSVDRMYEIAAEVAENMSKDIAPLSGTEDQLSLSDGAEQRNYGNYNYRLQDLSWYDDYSEFAPMAATESAATSDAPISAEGIKDAPIAKKNKSPQAADKLETAAPIKESAARPVKVNTAPGKKQRKWVKTSTDSEVVDGKVLPKDLSQDLIHYQPIPNKKTLGNANAKLDGLGYDRAVSYINSQFDSSKVTLDDIALGERLIQEAIKKGDTKTAADLIMDISILGTELGQKVQALSIIKRLTPEGQLRMLQRTVERGKTKGDKAFEGVEITQEMIDKILKTYGKDGTYDQENLNKAVEDVKQEIADQMKVGALDYINEWRYLSMLGNPKTHIRNFVSNVAMWGTRKAKNVLARTAEDLFLLKPVKNTAPVKPSIIPNGTIVKAADRGNIGTVISYDNTTGKYTVHFKNDRGQTATVKLDAKVITPIKPVKTNSNNGDIAPIKERTKTWEKASDDVKEFAKQITAEVYAGKKENKYSDGASIKAKRQIFKTKAGNWLSDLNSNALSGEDTFFSKAAYRSVLAEYLTANGIKTKKDIDSNPELVAKAKQYAMEQAKEATFQQDSYIASKINEIENKHPLFNVAVGAVLPFKKTPINVAKTAVAYSPLGFAKSVHDFVKVKKGDMAASEAVDSLAKSLTGTSLALIGFALANMGIINGAGEDDKEGKYDYQLGEQAYSFNFNGDTYSLSWLSPVAMPLFVGANFYEQLVEDKDWNADVVFETLAQTLDPLSEMSFLSSLDDVLSSYETGAEKFMGIFESAAQNYITQFAPTLGSQIASTFDDTKRSTKASANSDWKFGEETINQLMYKIPGLRNQLEPTTDIWGNEVKQNENFFGRAFESFLFPANRKEGISTYVDEELKNLYRLTGESGLIPSVPSNYVNYDKEKYEMSAEEYTTFKKTYGQTAYDLMEQLFTTETYQSADANARAKMAKRVYDYARDVALQEYLANYGIEYTNTTEDGVKVYKEDPIVGAIANDLTVDEYKLFARDPGKFQVSKVITKDFEQYEMYSKELSDIEADKDRNGKAISGSAKDKKVDYINSLDLDYGQKLILFKSQYKSDDTYNADIVKYLTSRGDLSYDEIIAILEELGFTITADGKVRW